MNYKGGLYAKIGGKYMKICHSDDFDKMQIKIKELEKQIEKLKANKNEK